MSQWYSRYPHPDDMRQADQQALRQMFTLTEEEDAFVPASGDSKQPAQSWRVTIALRDRETRNLNGLHLVVYVGWFEGEEKKLQAYEYHGPFTQEQLDTYLQAHPYEDEEGEDE